MIKECLSESGSLWLFGLWKTEFPIEESTFGYVKGWCRRFWQGSPDHRGVPGAVGRVVTMIPATELQSIEGNNNVEEITWGRAYSIPSNDVHEVLKQLDHREKAGYDRRVVDVFCNDGIVRKALVFIATSDNSDFLGPASLEIMAHEIASRVGPSGPNSQYLFNLCKVMRDINVVDPHLNELEQAVLLKLSRKTENQTPEQVEAA